MCKIAKKRAKFAKKFREEQTAVGRCPECHTRVSKRMLKKHLRDECPERLVECPEGCGEQVPFCLLAMHINPSTAAKVRVVEAFIESEEGKIDGDDIQVCRTDGFKRALICKRTIFLSLLIHH